MSDLWERPGSRLFCLNLNYEDHPREVIADSMVTTGNSVSFWIGGEMEYKRLVILYPISEVVSITESPLKGEAEAAWNAWNTERLQRGIFDHDHLPVQHRDGKPPWCDACGMDAYGNPPISRFEKPHERPHRA